LSTRHRSWASSQSASCTARYYARAGGSCCDLIRGFLGMYILILSSTLRKFDS
jgi:hypothetical protein